MAVELYYEPASANEAKGFAPWCQLHACDAVPMLASGYALWLDHQGLALVSAAYEQPFRLTAAMLDSRGQGQSLVARACGVMPARPSVLDPFAGFGLDAYVLARLGCSITVVERQPLVWLMLRGYANDMGLQVETACADGMQWLSDESRAWDVVYLDPMFAKRRKRALPNRGLQHLQDLQEQTADGVIDLPACLHLAQARARQRVVLKRRLKDPLIGKPSFQIKGQAVRFDVYL